MSSTPVGSPPFRELLSTHWGPQSLKQQQLLRLRDSSPTSSFQADLATGLLRLSNTCTVRGAVVATTSGDSFLWFDAEHPMVHFGRVRADSIMCRTVSRLKSLPELAGVPEFNCSEVALVAPAADGDFIPLGDIGAHLLLGVACRLLGGLFVYRCPSGPNSAAWFCALEEVDEASVRDEMPPAMRALPPISRSLMSRIAEDEAEQLRSPYARLRAVMSVFQATTSQQELAILLDLPRLLESMLACCQGFRFERQDSFSGKNDPRLLRFDLTDDVTDVAGWWSVALIAPGDDDRFMILMAGAHIHSFLMSAKAAP
jgi:hypothetical protein